MRTAHRHAGKCGSFGEFLVSPSRRRGTRFTGFMMHVPFRLLRLGAWFASALPLLCLTVQAADDKLVVRNAILFTLAAGQEKPFRGHFVVGADGTIATLGPGEPAPGRVSGTTPVYDAGGRWILPGFISAHSHLWQSAYRGLAFNQTLMGWAEAVYQQNAIHADPSSFYWFTLHGALDHLRHGITSVYNFNYSMQSRPGPFDEEQFRAEASSGVRFVHGYGVGRFGPAWSDAQATERMRAFMTWTQTQPGRERLLSVMINGSAAFVPGARQTQGEAAVMNALGVGNQVHFMESPPDKYEERQRFRWFLDAGLVRKSVIFGHYVHTDPWMLSETARLGASMSWNPLSNGRLASGIVDIPAYLKAGVRIGMGVDGQASADRADPFENMRMGLYLVRAKYEDATVLSPYDVLRLHTVGGADVLGIADRAGSLEKGKWADFLVVDPTDFGPVFDPYASLVFVGSVRDVERIYVNGDLKVQSGRLIEHDFPAIRSEVARRVKAPAFAP